MEEKELHFIISSELGRKFTSDYKVVAHCVELLERLGIKYKVLQCDKRYGKKYHAVKDVYGIG